MGFAVRPVKHLAVFLSEADAEGTWVTIRGCHVLIKDGESAADAFKRTTGKDLSDPEKKIYSEHDKTGVKQDSATKNLNSGSANNSGEGKPNMHSKTQKLQTEFAKNNRGVPEYVANTLTGKQIPTDKFFNDFPSAEIEYTTNERAMIKTRNPTTGKVGQWETSEAPKLTVETPKAPELKNINGVNHIKIDMDGQDVWVPKQDTTAYDQQFTDAAKDFKIYDEDGKEITDPKKLYRNR